MNILLHTVTHDLPTTAYIIALNVIAESKPIRQFHSTATNTTC